jgi:hypothetical protein
MDSKITNAKRAVLNFIFENSSDGVSESQVYSMLYEFDNKNEIFNYGNETTPESLIEGLVFKGLIIKICQENLKECKFYPAKVFA